MAWVRGRPRNHRKANGQAVSWILLSAEGEVISLHEDPVDYCKALRQVIEAAASPERLRALWSRNAVTIEMLRSNFRDLRTEKGEHYADILLGLYRRQLKELHEEQEADQTPAEAVPTADHVVAPERQPGQTKSARPDPLDQADTSGLRMTHAQGNRAKRESAQSVGNAGNPNGQGGGDISGQVDKAALSISAPRRIRYKEHLRFVASRPCLVCGRSPAQAHHIRYAQPRALSRKVSDEWTVPLCATHHRALHTVGDEKKWWKDRHIDPVTHAVWLWRYSQGNQDRPASTAREAIVPARG